MKSHVDTKHATSAKLRSKVPDHQQFLASIVVSEVENNGKGALSKKIFNEGVEQWVHT